MQNTVHLHREERTDITGMSTSNSIKTDSTNQCRQVLQICPTASNRPCKCTSKVTQTILRNSFPQIIKSYYLILPQISSPLNQSVRTHQNLPPHWLRLLRFCRDRPPSPMTVVHNIYTFPIVYSNLTILFYHLSLQRLPLHCFPDLTRFEENATS
jgi:hypothetical protein